MGCQVESENQLLECLVQMAVELTQEMGWPSPLDDMKMSKVPPNFSSMLCIFLVLQNRFQGG